MGKQTFSPAKQCHTWDTEIASAFLIALLVILYLAVPNAELKIT